MRYVDPDGRANFWGPFGGPSIKWAGAKIHRAVQDKLQSTYGGAIEQKITGAGRADYVKGNEIYEVKPVTQYNNQNGKDQLQNYVEHSPGSEKGTSLLSSIPNDISIENLEVVNTGSLKITCDVACITSTSDSNQSGMIYYVPYNWKIENNTNISTSIMVSLTVFGSVLSSGTSAAAETTATIAERAAATFVMIPTSLLNQYMNRIKGIDNDQI